MEIFFLVLPFVGFKMEIIYKTKPYFRNGVLCSLWNSIKRSQIFHMKNVYHSFMS